MSFQVLFSLSYNKSRTSWPSILLLSWIFAAGEYRSWYSSSSPLMWTCAFSYYGDASTSDTACRSSRISRLSTPRSFLPLCIHEQNNNRQSFPIPHLQNTALRQSATDFLTRDEISRYSRHLVLGEVGVKGQSALKNASVLVIGAGGLGSPCLLYLAAAGVGHIGIVDADVVDESNLQRQIIHGTSTVGVSKCESARKRILDINPHVNVRTYEKEFTSVTALEILREGFSPEKKWDVVVDGSDNFPTKYLINDACEIQNIPWVYSAILSFEGQISVFNYNNGPNYRDLLPVPPPPGDVPSCAEGGVLGVLPGTMGCLQATEVLKILLGKDQGLLVGRLLVFDALDMKFTEVGVQKLQDRQEISELIDYQGFCAGPKGISDTTAATATSNKDGDKGRTMDEVESDEIASGFQGIDPLDALGKLKSGWSPWVIDVRLQSENDIVALPFTDIVSPHRTVSIHDLPKEGDVLVYCKAGVRGKKACQRLIDLGVEPKRLYNLEGGIMRWRRDVDSSMPRY